MTRIRRILPAAALCAALTALAAAAPKRPDHPPIAVYFSPRGGCTDAIVAMIGEAISSIRVQAYSFTSHPIADALIAAHWRGVKVEIVLDGEQRTSPHSLGGHCADAGIPVAYDGKHAIAHNKVMVIDCRIIISGSFNFTAAAEHSNAENVVVLRDAPIAAAFDRNWTDHRAHSERRRPAGSHAAR